MPSCYNLLRQYVWMLIGLCISTSVWAAPKALVFYGSSISVKDREKMLKSKTGEDDITVFARSKDFFSTMEQSPPQIVIASSLFEMSRNDYDPVLQFSLAGKKEFRYKIVTLAEKKIDISKLETVSIGMIEEMDRQKMRSFFKDVVGLNITRTNLVSKPEDLFPLLVFNAADVITVSEDNYDRLVKVFTAKTKEIKIETHAISYPRVYLKKGESSDLIKKLEALTKEDLQVLGFDGVERIQK